MRPLFVHMQNGRKEWGSLGFFLSFCVDIYLGQSLQIIDGLFHNTVFLIFYFVTSLLVFIMLHFAWALFVQC